MATTAQVEQIVKLFIGYFNRAPAPGGTNYWTGRFEASSEGPAMTWAEIAESFSVQNETTTLYPIMETRDFSATSIQSFLNSVFQNLFGRDIREAGLNYYADQLTSTDPAVQRSVGEIILDIINGAVDGPDKARIDNKVAVSVDFFNKTDAIPGFVFDADARAVATSLLTGVTDDPATVTPALAQTNAYIATVDSGQPGVTINLTNNSDVPGGSGNGTDTQGTANNDTYQGTVEQSSSGTLQSADSIAGGDGTDTLNVRLIGTNSLSDVVTLNATGLEKINVIDQVFGPALFLMDLDAAFGVTEVTATGGNPNSATVFSEVDVGTQLRMVDVEGTLGIDFKGSQAASGSDSFDLYVQDSGTMESSSRLVFTENQFSGANEDFEIGNIQTGGGVASFLDLIGLALDRINVSGSQLLHLMDSSDGFEELEAARCQRHDRRRRQPDGRWHHRSGFCLHRQWFRRHAGAVHQPAFLVRKPCAARRGRH